MKKITLMIIVSLMSYFGYAQGLPLEKFDIDPWVISTVSPDDPAPPGWTVYNEHGPIRTWIQTITGNALQPPYGGTGHSAFLDREQSNLIDPIPSDWLITKPFTMPTNGELHFLSKLALNNDGGAVFKIMIGRVHTDGSMPTYDEYEQIQFWTELEINPVQTDWTPKKVIIPTTYTGDVRIAFIMQGRDADRWSIDNVRVSQACMPPSAGTVVSSTMTSADLSWTNPGGTSWEVEVIDETLAPTGEGVTYNGTLPYTAPNLQACTDYKFYVRQLCSDDGISDWVGPFFFKTRCLGENCASPIIIPPGLPYTTTSDTALYGDFYEGVPGSGCNATGNYLAGNDVVYSFTPTVTGNVFVSLSNTGGAAGVFIYNDCADIGTGCLAGALASADAAAELPTVPVVAGTTYYIVVSTSGIPQTTAYTLTIQQGSCPRPTNGTSSGVTGTSANLSWTAGTVGAASWQLAVQPVGTGVPVGAVQPSTTDNSDYTVTTTNTGAALQTGTSYEYYVREACGGGTFSVWAGPFLFTTLQVPSTLDYAQNFDGATHGWTLGNGGEVNKWVVGTATSNSPSKSLYISNNGGAAYNYTNTAESVVHAYRDIEMPPIADQLSLEFDWKAFGESSWDYIQVWLVPADFTPTPGDEIQPEDGIKIGAERYNLSDSWNTALAIIDASDLGGTNQRLVFQWTNDGSGGSQPPAAIDNINFKVITCPQPSALTIADLDADDAVITWTAPGIAPDSYDVYSSQTNTPPGDNDVSQNVPSNTATIGGLIPSATNFVWVRSHCSDTDKSFWTGPLVFNTPQIAADLNYTQNFDLGAHNFTLSNGTQPNKWVVGTATFNSPTSSLYISNNDGAANGYSTANNSVVHAYRDVNLPAGTDQLLLRYDWKSGGESTWDYMRVWFVPISFSPTPGVEMEESDDNILVADIFNLSTTWKTSQFVINAGAIGTTGRLIFEWTNDGGGGIMPGGAIDNINLSIITCPAPSDLVLADLTLEEASFEWTPPASAVPSYDYYYTTAAGEPAEDVEVSGTTATPNVTIPGLPDSTNYNFWVRSHCSDADGNSFWVGPLNFNTPQIPAEMDYFQNFDAAGTSGFSFVSGNQVNKWAVGSATSKSPSNSLYISNDNGVSYTYTSGGAESVVHAYRDIKIPAGPINEILFQFDWKSVGEWGDGLKIWIVPITFTPTPGEEISEDDAILQIGEDFKDNPDWKNSINVINATGWENSVKRIVFEWTNDRWQDNETAPAPGAIDNIKFSIITCSAPSAIVMPTLTGEDAVFSWTPPAVVPSSYDYYLTTDGEMPTEDTEVSGNTPVPTVTISGLPPNVNYNFWVRSNCGDEDGNSFWIGPLNFNTPQIAAELPYNQGFDGAGELDFTLVSKDQTNKWAVGAATFNSPANALYISNTDGATNTYNGNNASIVHAYRDINIPAGATNIDLAFDWKNKGDEYGSDYIKVWAVPLSYTPVAGQSISSNATRKLLSPELLGNDKWLTANYIIDGTLYTGAVRLVFEWNNNNWDIASFAGAIDNVDVKLLTCPKPSDLTAEEIGMTSAMLGWTENGTADAWEVYVVEQGEPFPSATTEGHDADSNPYEYELLEPGTKYEYYVKAICGDGDESRWAGPYAFNSNVCEIEDQCPYDFILTDFGNDGWNNNKMHVIQSGIVVAVLGPQIQDDEEGGPITVSVPLCSGIPFEVFWVNGNNIGAYGYEEVGLKIVNPFTGQAVFDRIAGSAATNMGTTIFTGMSFCAPVTCAPPSNLVSESVANVPNTTQLSWVPSGTETQWEILIQAQGGKFPTSTPPADSTHIVDEPKHTETLVPGMLYEYYVRAICGPDDKSFWTGPLYFSIFTPPACADVKVFDPELEIVAPDTEYVLCEGDEVAIKFSANYFESASTTSYAVESIPYNLPFPTTGGTKMDITEDDQWAPVADLPFEFCFFGEVYNKAQVGSNGVISFNANYQTGDNCRYYWDGALIPDPSFEIKNAIYGVYQDIDVTAASSLANPEINYQVIGNYPCRAFVVNFSEIAQFGSGCHEDASVGAQTSQIVIYEITNIIEVYVKNRVACTEWREGEGVIGVQNADGTAGFTPPDRNTGPWSAQNEAWRFVPNGASASTFEWFKNGDLFSTDKEIEVIADETAVTTMTARATYNLCNGDVIVRESNFVLRVQEEIITADPKDLLACGNGEIKTFDLNDALVDITNPADYIFTFYATEAAAEAGEDTNDLPATFETATSTVIWVRIMKTGSPCYIVKSFDITISNVAPVFTVTPDYSICAGDVTPHTITVTPDGFNVGDATYTWTLNGDPFTGTTNSITATAAGEYEVTVNKNGCIGTATITVTAIPVPVVDDPADVTVCGAYTLPALTSGNYFGQPGGVEPLSALEDITVTKTIYVYAASGTTPNCVAENSFVVTIVPKPELAPIDNVTACDVYVLPALTEGNYFTEAAGAGTKLEAGASITTVGTTTLYVYAESGTTPNCTDEVSFTVTIATKPVVAEFEDVVQCVSYKLPALTSGKYYSGANGVGEIAVGTELTTSQTVYVYAESGTTPNCTAETSFIVTIIPTAIIATTQGCEGNEYTLEVLFDGDPTYSADNTTIEWTDSKGTLVGSEAKLIVKEIGIYTVTITPNGGIECPVSDDVIVAATTCMIPRGISPNKDGFNDNFDLSSLKVKHISIFNRYGKEVYEKDNYKDEFNGQGTHGDDLPTGTYFYMIEREGGESITGWVYINREE